MTAILSMIFSFIFGLALPVQAQASGGALNLTVEQLVWALVYIIIIACIIGLLWFLLNYITPMLGEPIARFARIAFVIVVVLFLIVLLLKVLGAIH